MSIIDDVRIKQNWTPDGYQFDKDAKNAEPELDGEGYFTFPRVDAKHQPNLDDSLKRAAARQAQSGGIVTGRNQPEKKSFADLLRDAQKRGQQIATLKGVHELCHKTGDTRTYTYTLRVGTISGDRLVAIGSGPVPDEINICGVLYSLDTKEYRDSHPYPVSYSAARWADCPRKETLWDHQQALLEEYCEKSVQADMDFAEIEKRIVLDMETRSQVGMDPGQRGGDVLAYAYKLGDGPVVIINPEDQDFAEIEKRYAEDE